VDGVYSETVSPFPVYREKYREFCTFYSVSPLPLPDSHRKSIDYSKYQNFSDNLTGKNREFISNQLLAPTAAHISLN